MSARVYPCGGGAGFTLGVLPWLALRLDPVVTGEEGLQQTRTELRLATTLLLILHGLGEAYPALHGVYHNREY